MGDAPPELLFGKVGGFTHCLLVVEIGFVLPVDAELPRHDGAGVDAFIAPKALQDYAAVREGLFEALLELYVEVATSELSRKVAARDLGSLQVNWTVVILIL